MSKGLFIDRHVVSSMRVDIMSFHIISINNSISDACSIFMSIILETLSLEIFSEPSVR